MPETDPQKHELWNYFVHEARRQCISLDHEDDWLDNWKMFLAGAQAHFTQELKACTEARKPSGY